MGVRSCLRWLLAKAGEWSSQAPPQALRAQQLRPACHYAIKILGVVDGDTFHVEVDLGYGVVLKETLRCMDYDAPESRRVRRTVGEITDDELARGKEASAAVRTYLESAESIWLDPGPGRRDAYGRILGRILVGSDLLPLADWMREQGYVR